MAYKQQWWSVNAGLDSLRLVVKSAMCRMLGWIKVHCSRQDATECDSNSRKSPDADRLQGLDLRKRAWFCRMRPGNRRGLVPSWPHGLDEEEVDREIIYEVLGEHGIADLSQIPKREIPMVD